MERYEFLSYIDHTALNPCSTWDDIDNLCKEAIKYKVASVCVPPCYVHRVAEAYKSEINICTVIGFPLGFQSTDTKVYEAKCAVRDGANEVDMVINLGDVKNKEFNRITQEIASIKKAIDGKLLKVIIETCYLDEGEKINLCRCVTESGADYIKTSTGFGKGGATLEDINLIKPHVGENVKIKASGGIRCLKDIAKFIDAGCDRIGTSSAVKCIQSE